MTEQSGSLSVLVHVYQGCRGDGISIPIPIPYPGGIPIGIPMGIPIPTEPEVSTLFHVGYHPL